MEELKVLVIEDDKYILNFIVVSLKKEGYTVASAGSADEGMFLFCGNKPDMVLLDLGLPDRDGLEVIKGIRELSAAPILIVSARGQETDKVDALDAGADDYITKPFHMGELLARMRVARRRLQQLPASETEFVCDYLTVGYDKRRVLVEGEEVHLTPMEYKVLLLLIANRGKVLTHSHINREVWGYSATGDTKTIRVLMANLRRKIEKNITSPRFIKTEVGVGYRFVE